MSNLVHYLQESLRHASQRHRKQSVTILGFALVLSASLFTGCGERTHSWKQSVTYFDVVITTFNGDKFEVKSSSLQERSFFTRSDDFGTLTVDMEDAHYLKLSFSRVTGVEKKITAVIEEELTFAK
jgi:hypothetical protein